MGFNQAFKEQAVQKALQRPEGTSLEIVAKEIGVGYSTLQTWIRNFDSTITTEQSPHQWSAEQRLQALIASKNLSEEELNSFCRQQGIYPHHITQWQQEFESMTSPTEQLKVEREEKRLLKSELRTVQKELQRKEKALAETAALLVLQKKAYAIWGNAEGT